MPPTKKVLLWIGSPGAMTSASTTRLVLASCALLWWWITNTEWMGGPEDRSTLLLKVKGRRERLGDVVEKVEGDDTTEQQGEVARANMVRVLVGVGSPPSVGCGWEGRTLSGGLGTRGRWRQPVRRQGWTRWRTVRRWPLMIGGGISDGARARDVARVLPPIVERTAPT
jgi:hypothetical protein